MTPPSLQDHSRYEFVGQISKSAGSHIFLAYDTISQGMVAVKSVERDHTKKQVSSEFRLLSDLYHPNLVQFHDLYFVENSYLFSMEYVEGKNFAEYIAGYPNTLSRESHLLSLLQQVAEGLDALHRSGIVHCDLKPENILVKNGTAKILDFGVSKSASVRNSEKGFTPMFAAPEQIWGGKPDQKSDWYSFGVLLYLTLTNEMPFSSLASKRRGFTQESTKFASPTINNLTMSLIKLDPNARPGIDRVREVLKTKVNQYQAYPLEYKNRRKDIFGRTQKMEIVEDIVNRAQQQGRSYSINISGDSGIGKSAFVTEVQNRNLNTFIGRCYPHEHLVFNGINSLMHAIVSSLGTEKVETLVNQMPALVSSALSQVFPELVGSSIFEDQGSDNHLRSRAYSGIVFLLQKLAQEQSCILIIDDYQWADKDTQTALSSLIESLCDTPIVFIKVVRNSRAVVERNTISVHLAPLTVDASKQLVINVSPQLDQKTIAEILRVSDGIPIDLAKAAEVLRHNAKLQKNTLSRKYIFERMYSSIADNIDFLRHLAIAGTLSLSATRHLFLAHDDLISTLYSLFKQNYISYITLHGDPEFQLYHDRITGVVRSSTEGQSDYVIHGRLIKLFRSAVHRDVPRLHYHLNKIKKSKEAAIYAFIAGKQAQRRAAFSTALKYFEYVVENSTQPFRQHVARLEIAKSLSLAGRSQEAAIIHIRNARSPFTNRDVRRNLSILAAGELLTSGNFLGGGRLFRTLIRNSSIEYPDSHSAAQDYIKDKISNGSDLLKRPIKFNTDGGLALAAARGFVSNDMVRGSYFVVKAIETCNPQDLETVTKLKAMLGGIVLGSGSRRLRKFARSITSDAIEESKLYDEMNTHAFALSCMSNLEFMAGNWIRALELSKKAINVFDEKCVGVNWERSVAEMICLRSLQETAKHSEMEDLAKILVSTYSSKSNKAGLVMARGYLAQAWLMKDRVESARALVQKNVSLWNSTEYTMQHFYAARVQAMCDLVENMPLVALERLRKQRENVERARLRSIPMFNIDYCIVNARAAINAFADTGNASYAVDATLQIRSLLGISKRHSRQDARAHALLLMSNLYFLSSKNVVAEVSLHKAKYLFSSLQMEGYVETCRDIFTYSFDGATKSTSDISKNLNKPWLRIAMGGFQQRRS